MIDIEQLRQKILDLAISGKLVPQDKNDEPASVLLDKISSEKKHLFSEGKIRKQNEAPSINGESDNRYYENLPLGWVKSSLGSIAISISDGSHNPPQKQEVGIPILSALNISNDKINMESAYRWVSEKDFIEEKKRTNIEKNDVLLTIVGTIGRTAVVNSSVQFCLQRSVCVIKPCLINSQFLAYELRSSEVKKQMIDYAAGTAQQGIYLHDIATLSIVIPPLNEQTRIVKMLKTMLSLLSQIETNLSSIATLSYLLKREILSSAFNSYKSYYDETEPFENDVEIFDNLRRPINKNERNSRLAKAVETFPYYGATGRTGTIDEYVVDGEYVLLGEDGAPFLDKNSPKAYIINGKAWINNHVHILRSKTSNQFLMYFLNWLDYASLVSGTTRLKLTQEKMKSIRLPKKTKNEKENIAAKIGNAFSIIDSLLL